MSAREAQHRVAGISLESWPVTDDRGFAGMVTASAISDAAPDVTVGELLGAQDERTRTVHVHTDHPIGEALARMGESGHRVIPVVSRANGTILLGIVTLSDVLKAFGVES
jgi:CBS domain-containing protein